MGVYVCVCKRKTGRQAELSRFVAYVEQRSQRRVSDLDIDGVWSIGGSSRFDSGQIEEWEWKVVAQLWDSMGMRLRVDLESQLYREFLNGV